MPTVGMLEYGERSWADTDNHIFQTDRANGLISHGKNLSTKANIHDDGRVNLSLACQNELQDLPDDHARPVREYAVDSNWGDCPPLSIVIMIVGSRGLPRDLYELRTGEMTTRF